MTLTALAGALTGVLLAYLHVIGPDKPADPVVTREEAQAAKVETWRQCAAKRKLGLGCHPTTTDNKGTTDEKAKADRKAKQEHQRTDAKRHRGTRPRVPV